MKTRVLMFISMCVVVLLFVLSGDSMAASKAKGRAKFELPANAVPVGPDVYYLGKAKDKGREVEGYAIIKRKEKPAKPGTACGNGVCEPGENARKCPEDCGSGGEDPTEPDTSGCYGFLAKGARWKTVEPYVFDPSNGGGLPGGAVSAGLEYGIGQWNAAAGTIILGSGESATGPLAPDTESTDGLNEVLFADITEPGVIAVTIVWGIFSGPPFGRELVEWDQVYDDYDFDWTDNGTAQQDCMDFYNIAIHELGHSCGLADLYSDECSEQTMYGYATEGETKKMTLEDGDIAGITKLYE
jgi:hypothetical protein